MTWTGGGLNNLWGNAQNWSSSPLLPQSTDVVCHDSGNDEIEFDLESATIAAFVGTGDAAFASRSLTIADGNTLMITGDVVNDSASADVYQVTVEGQGAVVIGGASREMSFLLESGTEQDPTEVSVAGDISAGEWVVEADAQVQAQNSEITGGDWYLFGGTLTVNEINGGDWYLFGGTLTVNEINGGVWTVNDDGFGAQGVVLPVEIKRGDWLVDFGLVGSPTPVRTIRGGTWTVQNDSSVEFSELIDARPIDGEGGDWTVTSSTVARAGIVERGGTVIIGGTWDVSDNSSILAGRIVGDSVWSVHDFSGSGEQAVIAGLWSPQLIDIDAGRFNLSEGSSVGLFFTTQDSELRVKNAHAPGLFPVQFKHVGASSQFFVRLLGGASASEPNLLHIHHTIEFVENLSALEYCGNFNILQNTGRFSLLNASPITRMSVENGCSDPAAAAMELRTAHLEFGSSSTGDLSGVTLRMIEGLLIATGPSLVETLETDWGPAWFCDLGPHADEEDPRIHFVWADFIVDHDSRLIDNYVNDQIGTAPALYPDEGMVVGGDATVSSGVTLDTNGLKVYVRGTAIIDGTVTGGGSVQEIDLRHFGDFDADGDIDSDDLARMLGSGPVFDPLLDADLDGSITTADKARFSDNMELYGSNSLCTGGSAASASIGVPTAGEVEGIVAAAESTLTASEMLHTADAIAGLISAHPDRPDASAMLDIASAFEALAQP